MVWNEMLMHLQMICNIATLLGTPLMIEHLLFIFFRKLGTMMIEPHAADHTTSYLLQAHNI